MHAHGIKARAPEGRKLIVVPTLTLSEQWQDRIRQWTGISQGEVDIVTYHAFDKVRAKDYTLTIYDECHRLPANQFSRLATIKTKYRMGLLTPQLRPGVKTDEQSTRSR